MLVESKWVLVIYAFLVTIANYHTYFLQEFPAIARKLGEDVLAKCAVKLKPFLKQAVELSGLSLDGYTEVVTTICKGSNGEAELDNVNVSEEQVVCILCS